MGRRGESRLRFEHPKGWEGVTKTEQAQTRGKYVVQILSIMS